MVLQWIFVKLSSQTHGQTPEYELPLRAEDIQPLAAESSPDEGPAAQPESGSEAEHSQSHGSNEAAADDELSVSAANQQSEAPAPEPVPATAGGGGEPPYIPPENQASISPEFPEPERHIASYPVAPPETRYGAPVPPIEDAGTAMYASVMPPLSPRIITAPVEQLVTRRELDSAVTSAERAGASRGLLTGLIVGGAYEHFKHKRREKRQEKKHQQATKKLEQARADYQFAAVEQTRKQDITEHQLRTAERRLAESQKTGFGIPARPETIARAAAGSPEVPRPPASAAERFSAPRPEHVPQPAQSQKTPEKSPVIDTEQGIDVPADQRLIREGAFIAQVEKATGKVVENPSFAYGHEYHRERAQEAALHTQQTVATGEVALTAASIDQPGQRQPANGGGTGGGGVMGSGSLPAPVIPSAATQGPPPRTPSRPTDNASGNAPTEQPLWPWVAALIVIVICLVVLLR